MSEQTYVVHMSNEDIVLRVAKTSFGSVRVVPQVIGQLRVGGGVPGPPGQNGSSGAGFTFYQNTPSETWLINHNLGFYPSVDLFNTGGMEILGEVVNTSVNQTIVNYNGAIAGSARLN